MKQRTTLFILTFLLLSIVFPVSLNAQERSKRTRESKKELAFQRDSLLAVVDSLKNELSSFQIELADTLSVEDTINPGLEEIEYQDTILDRDSLMSLWYNQRNLPLIQEEFMNLDTCNLSSEIPDSVFINRLKKMNSFISIPYNKAVRNQLIYYTQRIPESVERMLGLSFYYMPIFEEIFDQYDLPKELKAMAIIESFLNPVAVSRVKARGMWQFMYNTALRYDLKINSYVDERYDPIKSAHAAAKYLRDSYLIFGDWAMAIASYNCGVGNVNKAIRRSNGGTDIWDIYPYLPRETRGYIPSFVAALYTMTYYREHNLNPSVAQLPAHVDTLKINKMLHFEQISHFTGASIEELKNLNPQYLHNIIPGVEREYILRIPYQYTNKFIDNESKIYSYKDSLYFNPTVLKSVKETAATSSTRIVHTVKKGETLGHIAMKYRVKVSEIQRWNSLRGTKINLKQKLVIYTNGKGPAQSSSKTASSATSKTTTTGGYITYTIKKGDTLWDVSQMYSDVSLSDIMTLNGLTRNSKIYPGMKIKIKKSN